MTKKKQLPHTVYIGVDWATNRWHVIISDIDGNILDIDENVIKMSIKPDKRRVILADSFKGFLRGLEERGVGSILLFVEEPISPPGRSKKGIRSLCMTVGALTYATSSVLCAEWAWIEVTKWKAFVGKNKSKEAAKQFFLVYYDKKTNNSGRELEKLEEDHYDAGCILAYSLKQLKIDQKS